MAPVQDMIKQVEQENLQQTIARSRANPGALQTGGTVRYTAGGLLPPTEIKNQAYTGTGVSQGAQANLDAIARKNQAEIDNKANRAAQNKADIAAANAPAASTPTRYDATGNINTSGNVQTPSGIMSADEYAAKFGPKPVDEAAIRESVRAANQGRIDAINAAYDAMAGDQQVKNISNMGSTRAISARSGLLGSDFGNAALQNQDQAGGKAIAAINAERADKVAATLADVNLKIDQKIQAERDAAKMNANDYKTYYDKAQAEVRDSVKNLGASGVSFDQLKEKDPSQLKKILDSTGMSKFELAMQLNSAKRASEKIDWKLEKVGNVVIASGVNPLTGKLEYQTQQIPAEFANNDVKEVNGELWSIGADGKTAIKIGGEKKVDLPASAQEYQYAVANGYKGSYTDYQNEDANRRNIISGGGKRSTSVTEVGGRKLLIDTQTGETISDLGAATDAVGGQIVRINGVDYQKNPDGSYSQPKVPEIQQQMTELKHSALTSAQDLLEKFNSGNKWAVGGTSWIPAMPGSSAADFKIQFNNLKSLLSLDNVKLLKGQGQVSDAERRLLAEASAKLELGQSEGEFKKALEDIVKGLSGVGDQNQTGQLPDPQVKELLDQGYSPDQVNQILGKTNDRSTSLNYSNNGLAMDNIGSAGITNLGELSSRYESGGDPGSIGYDQTGGYSYGTYQLAHQNAKNFIDESPYANEFKGLTFNSPAWRAKWQAISQKDPQGFEQAQHDYIAKTHFEPQIQKLAQAGLQIDKVSPVLENVIWSTAVQHGPNNDIIIKALNSLGKNATQADLIRKIYALRWNGGMNFASSTPAVRKSVRERFFGPNGELNTALSMLG